MNETNNIPSGAEQAKMIQSGHQFLQEMSSVSNGEPDFRLMLWNVDGIRALKQWGEYSFIDGTHNVVTGKTVTILMGNFVSFFEIFNTSLVYPSFDFLSIPKYIPW